MKFGTNEPRRRRGNGRMAALVAGLATVLAGCDRGEIQVYRVAKESPARVAAGGATAESDAAEAPRVLWKAPETWEEQPAGQMRLASFRSKGPSGETAEISIVPLPGLAGSDLDNVNRWRGQMGLAAVTAEELPKLAEAVAIAGQSAQLFDLAGQVEGSGAKARILAAVLRREGVAWFFKMTGDDVWVARQKPLFVDFLKSVEFRAAQELPAGHPPVDAAAAGGAPGPAVAAEPAAARPQWQAPASWKEVPGGTFLVAKFLVDGADPAQPAVNVSRSEGDGGGWVSNVNRWRRQLGLNEGTEAEIDQQTRRVQLADGQVHWIDLTGTDAKSGQKARLVAAMAPRGGQSWFYKLMGGEVVVAHELNAFTQFVQTVQYPHAR